MQPTYRMLVWILALSGFGLDQASKYGVFSSLERTPDQRHELIPGAFDLVAQRKFDGTPHVNQGALFGFGQGAEQRANGTFAAISFLAAGAIIFWAFQRATTRDRGLCFALGLILAGTLGNLYDRLFFGGVRDFLHWHYAFDWPVFNVADCCLVCGAGLLLIQAFRAQPELEEGKADPGRISLQAASHFATAAREK